MPSRAGRQVSGVRPARLKTTKRTQNCQNGSLSRGSRRGRNRANEPTASAPKRRKRTNEATEAAKTCRKRANEPSMAPSEPTSSRQDRLRRKISLCLLNPPKIPVLSNLARTHCGQRTKHLGDGVRSARFDLCRLFEGQRILQFTARGTNHKGGELNRKGGLERLTGLHRVCRLWWVYVRRRPGKLRRIAGWVRLTDAGQHGNHQTQLRELTLRQGVGAGPSWRRRPSSVPGCRTRPPR